MLITNDKFWKSTKIDYLFVAGEINRFWITGFPSSHGYLLIKKADLSIKVFLDARYLDEGCRKIKNAQVLPINQFLPLWKQLTGLVGFEMDLPYYQCRFFKSQNSHITLRPINFQHLRMIKSTQEIDALRTVCQKTVHLWKQVVSQWTKFENEKQLERFLLQQSLDLEISEHSFFPIVSSGLNTALIHTKAKNQQIQNNLLCDFGLKLNGYCSDFTRSLIWKNDHLNKYYEIIQEIQQAIIQAIKPGVKISTLAQIAKTMYQKHNLKLEHAIGHGIGLEVHEYPIIDLRNEQLLQPGMVFTVEPGVYFSQWGGVRVEDVVVVTKTGCEILTKT